MDEKSETQQRDLRYRIDYRNIKYPRLEFKTGSLLLVLPKNYENPTTLIEKHNEWINKKEETIKRALQEAEERDLILTRTVRELKNQVHSIAHSYRKELKFKVDKIYFRKMKTKWGSYSPNRNLTINTFLKYLPERLIEYVIFHELAHSLERKHNEGFWKIVAKKFEDYQAREDELLAYWFLVQRIICTPATV